MSIFHTPVLVTLWDNPDYVRKLMTAIGEAKPAKMYLFSDSVNDRSSERYSRIQQTRKIAKEMITWDAKVLCRFNEKNEGPSWGIHNAISWAFEHTDRLIVLEHDYIPSCAFFPFCETLLEKYLSDDRIWIISGLNHFEGKFNLNNEDSYFFSKYSSIAGFATWKRCWDHVDNKMNKWPLFLKQNYKFDDFDEKKWKVALKKYSKFYGERILKDNLNTWDVQFVFAIWSNRGTGIVPAKNLIKMIGVNGFNTSSASPFHFFKTYDDFKIIKHPDFIQNNHIYDEQYFKAGYFYMNRSFLAKGLNRLKKQIDRLKIK
jgi:hypothetical protein